MRRQYPFTTRRFQVWLVAVTLVFSLFMTGCGLFVAPGHVGPRTRYFDGTHFRNQEGVDLTTAGQFLKWQFNRDQGPWDSWVSEPLGEPPPKKVSGGDLRVTFINHSTVLIQMDGLNVLTDPIWSKRCSPVSWAGPKRHRAPGIRFSDLPPIDLVMVSHNHYDHLDVQTLRRLSREHRPLVLAGLGNRAYLSREGIEPSMELGWWQHVTLPGGLEVWFVPARHFSGRGTTDRNQTLWGGFVLKGRSGAVYFAGDTGMGRHFKQVVDRFGPLRLALLPIGAYRPVDFMSRIHISPSEAVEAHRILGEPISVGIHFGTFQLADDGQTEPIEELNKSMKKANISDERFWVLNHGEGRLVPPRSDAPRSVQQ